MKTCSIRVLCNIVTMISNTCISCVTHTARISRSGARAGRGSRRGCLHVELVWVVGSASSCGERTRFRCRCVADTCGAAVVRERPHHAYKHTSQAKPQCTNTRRWSHDATPTHTHTHTQHTHTTHTHTTHTTHTHNTERPNGWKYPITTAPSTAHSLLHDATSDDRAAA